MPPQPPHGQYPYAPGQQPPGWPGQPGYAQPPAKRGGGKAFGIVVMVVIGLVVLCGGAGAVAYFSGVFGAGDPTKVVEDYFAAAQRGDCEKMVDLVTEETWRQGGATSRGQAVSECRSEMPLEGLPIQLVSTRLISEGAETAVVAATVTSRPGLIDDPAPGPVDLEIPLRKEGRNWKIDGAAPGGFESIAPPGGPSAPGPEFTPPDIEIPDLEPPGTLLLPG